RVDSVPWRHWERVVAGPVLRHAGGGRLVEWTAVLRSTHAPLDERAAGERLRQGAANRDGVLGGVHARSGGTGWREAAALFRAVAAELRAPGSGWQPGICRSGFTHRLCLRDEPDGAWRAASPARAAARRGALRALG